MKKHKTLNYEFTSNNTKKMDSIIINMENYNKTVQLSFSFIKERMKELKIPQYKLAEMIGISEVTLIRNFKRETEMSFCTYVKLCLVLNIPISVI